MSEIVDQIAKIVEEALQGPLALPIAVGIATVFLTVVLFYSISKSGNKQQKERRILKADDTNGGTTLVDGVRRSTRAPKTSSKYDIAEVMASPAPRKSPVKKATPATKEAVTVSPKKRGRPAKSPAPTPAAESQSSTPRRRGRPRKSQ